MADVASETSEKRDESVEAAKSAGLRYVTDRRPGIKRLRSGKSFRYVGPDGKPVRDEETLGRVKSLVIPPAWEDVWICPAANGHLQATGRDARGRKQSRYHPRWRATRDANKYERMAAFARALPKIRRRVAADLRKQGLPREKVLATIVSLMEQTHIRVGNEEYARTNKSYGLTTMRNRHVDVHGAEVTFSFQGKSGVKHAISLRDKRLAKIVRQCEELPGQELFEYVDADGSVRNVDSSDVNSYLQEITREHFTAKDFRTWAGSVLACELLNAFEPWASEAEAKRNVVQAIAAVAKELGNTPSVCRKCYVHPVVLETYLSAGEKAAAKERVREIEKQVRALRVEEQRLVELLTVQAMAAKRKPKGLAEQLKASIR